MNGIFQSCPYLDMTDLYTFRQLVAWIVCTALVMFLIGVLVGSMGEARAARLDEIEDRLETQERNQRQDRLRDAEKSRRL